MRSLPLQEVHMARDKQTTLITALYCRLSKDDGTNSESMSISTQKDMLMSFAKQNGFINCKYYVDDGYSGTTSDRPASQKTSPDLAEITLKPAPIWRYSSLNTESDISQSMMVTIPMSRTIWISHHSGTSSMRCMTEPITYSRSPWQKTGW